MVAFALICCLAVFDTFLPSCGTLSLPEANPATLAVMVKGRVLLCFIKEGMSEEEVTHVLGERIFRELYRSGDSVEYFQFGIVVHFEDHRVKQYHAFRQGNRIKSCFASIP